jgi:hypothetical protein
MELYIGRRKSWDACTYPRVGQWPLSVEKESALLAKYVSLLVAAYATYEIWKQHSYNLDEYFVRAEIDSTELPEKVYVVLGAHPEKITWSGEWAPYRLRIEVVWCSKRKANPAFASAKEAQDFMQECLVAKTESRFTVVELVVVR